MSEAYPLHWPKDWPRTIRPTSSRFNTSVAGALKNVNEELVRFGKDSNKKVENIVISSNVTLGQQRPSDSGVAVYFTWDGISTCIAVDRYLKVEENLQAIFHCLDAERTKLRHGGINLVKAAFRGYAALPPPVAGERDSHWSEILLVDRSASVSEIKKAYRALAHKHHPDKKQGNEALYKLVKSAYECALEEKGA